LPTFIFAIPFSGKKQVCGPEARAGQRPKFNRPYNYFPESEAGKSLGIVPGR